MVGVGFKKGRKIKFEAGFSNDSFETAVAFGESLARHRKGEVAVFLYNKGESKVKILKRIKMVRAGFLWLGRRLVTV